MLKTIEIVCSQYRKLSWLNRNYKKSALILVIFIILVYVSTTFLLLFSCDNSDNNDSNHCFITNTYATSNCVITIAVFVCGLKYTDSFDIYVIAMDNVHLYCSKKSSYKKRMNFLLKTAIACVTFYAIIYLGYLIFVITNIYWLFMMTDIASAFRTSHQMIVLYFGDVLFTAEIFMFALNLRRITICLLQFKENLSTMLESLDTTAHGYDITACFKIQEDLRQMAGAYNIITFCSNELKKLYGVQVTILVFLP